MDRTRDRLGGRWRRYRRRLIVPVRLLRWERWLRCRLLRCSEASRHRNMSRPALGSLRLLWCSTSQCRPDQASPALRSLRLLGAGLHRLWVPVLRLGAVELARRWLRRGRGRLWLLLRLWLGVLRLLGHLLRHRSRCLPLPVLLRSLLTRCSTTLSIRQSRKLTRKNRLFIAWRNLLAVKRNVQLDARLAASILRVLAGIKSGQQFLNQGVGKLQVAFVIRLVGSALAIVYPKRSAIGAIL